MTNHPVQLHSAAEYLGNLEGELRSLEFCRKVYEEFAVGAKPATENMDTEKAKWQLIACVDRVLEAFGKR